MTKRNSSQRVQDVIDRLSDLNVRELDALARSLSRYDNQTLSRVLEQIVYRAGKLVTFPVNFEREPLAPEIDPDFELKEPGVAPSIDEDSLPIIRTARQNGVIP